MLPTICILGPTSSGKTELALLLADKIDCEIISVDSALVYRGMDIGTAKPSLAIRTHRLHHLIDICDVTEPYSAAKFEADANQLIQAIHQRGKIPLLVGGTMLYFRALLFGLSSMPEANQTIRAEITEQAKQNGWQTLHDYLAKVDPLSAERIKVSDTQRLQRALEVYLTTGKTLSSHWQSDKPQLNHSWQQQCFCIEIAPSTRTLLHARIGLRFQAMLDKGLIAEVEQFYQRPDVEADLPAMRSVGYRQVWSYLAGEIAYEEMINKAVAATRQLAKRQLTWLRHWPERYPVYHYLCDEPADYQRATDKITTILFR
ncbi:MAG: miaA [Gammaproteobacteria bacterium]|jgi:tRNA dimethylallyltransferase|nr:miaA [Gammaproteobacteria bacterium]